MLMRPMLLDSARETELYFDDFSVSAALQQVCRSQHLPGLPDGPASPDPQERRRHPRIRARVPVLVTAVMVHQDRVIPIGRSSLSGTTTDLSREGIGLEMYGRPASDLVHLEFPSLSDLRLSFIVRIQWQSPNRDGFRRSGGALLAAVVPTNGVPADAETGVPECRNEQTSPAGDPASEDEVERAGACLP